MGACTSCMTTVLRTSCMMTVLHYPLDHDQLGILLNRVVVPNLELHRGNSRKVRLLCEISVTVAACLLVQRSWSQF